MYLQTLIDGIFDGQPKALELRDQWYKDVEEFGNDYLHAKLQEKDPQAAAKIHPNDVKKVIRALEVVELKGEPLTEVQNRREGLSAKYDIYILGLSKDREVLYEDINSRVDTMVEAGLIDEIKKANSIGLGLTAAGMIGVKEIVAYLNDEYGLDEGIRLMKQNTRRFAKRQMTWFRNQMNVDWVDMTNVESIDPMVDHVLTVLK